MTDDQQWTEINTATYLPALLAKIKSTMAVLSQNQLEVDDVTMRINNVPNKLYMPKGGDVAHLAVGERADGGGPIIDLPQVPVGWLSP